MLGSAGTVKRDRITFIKRNLTAANQPVDEANIAENLPEQEVRRPPVTPGEGGGGGQPPSDSGGQRRPDSAWARVSADLTSRGGGGGEVEEDGAGRPIAGHDK